MLAVTGLAGELAPGAQYDPASWPDAAERFAARFATRTRDDWAQAAEAHDACLSPVLDFAEAARHPHNRANGLFVDEPYLQPGPPIGFDRPD